MSIAQKIDIECPRCGYREATEVWYSINTQLNPEAGVKLLKGVINQFSCSHCDFKSFVPIDLLYHDVENEFCVHLTPFQTTEDNNVIDRFTENGEWNWNPGLPEEHVPDYFKHIHLVLSMGELARYIIFRRRLTRRKNSIKKGLKVCFSCHSTIANKDSYFCVSRLHTIKGEAKENKENILEAVASIQLCSDCIGRAATEKIELSDLPLPVLNLEKEGLHEFAKWRANKATGWKSTNNAPYICSICQITIDTDDKYTRIEIAEEKEGEKGIKVKELLLLGVLCESCAEDYLVWL